MNPFEFSNIRRCEERMWWFVGMRRVLYRFLDPLAAGRRIGLVLEAGCGTGCQSRELERRYGWKMIGVDLAWEGLCHARRLPVERLVQADVSRLPAATGSVDGVISLDVLVHFRPGEEQAALAEFARVLKPGGFAVIRVSALDVLRSRHSAFAWERQRFTSRRLKAALEEAGFVLRRISYCNTLLLPVALARFRLWEPLLRAPVASGVVMAPRWINALLKIPLILESWWISLGRNFPIGQSLLALAEKPAPPRG